MSKVGKVEIKKLKKALGRDIAIFGSNNLCISLLKLGLLDEFRIIIKPVIKAQEQHCLKG